MTGENQGATGGSQSDVIPNTTLASDTGDTGAAVTGGRLKYTKPS